MRFEENWIPLYDCFFFVVVVVVVLKKRWGINLDSFASSRT